ncbi:MAG: hypothetical protein HY271_10235 [Deltaproteobacteria bacterium]|nr:hypothetical protein [Deltaproteobacteria bacterium]
MNVEMRGMRTGLAAAIVLIAVLWGMAGCGGSGSSGFDVSPLTEAQAITRAIDSGQCVAFEQQTICASGAEARATPLEGALVIIEEPSSPLVCDGDAPAQAQSCTASLEFTTVGFSTPTSLRAAVSDSERGPWSLVPLTVSEDVTGPRTVSITVPGIPDATKPMPVIAAVLVNIGPAPEPAPQTAAHLADFSVDVVYVSSRLEIVVPR